MAALRISRPHGFAMRQLRHDPVSHRIFSRAFFGCPALESSDIRVFVWSDGVRSLRFRRNRNPRTASADRTSNRTREDESADHRNRRACAKLGLSAVALAEILGPLHANRRAPVSDTERRFTETPYNI
jgi:hypothetical protein